MSLLKSPLSEDELNRMLPEDNQQEPDAYTMLLNAFTQKNTEALVKCELICVFYGLLKANQKTHHVIIETLYF